MTIERKNWIDWAKCIAITMVVLGHIPQEKESFLPFYICIFHIPLFFFISGYLTKERTDTKEELKKCWHSLVIPYILYNIIFYPYWAIRLHIDHGVDFSFFEYITKPILGIILLQIDSPISSKVNGAMWFIVVLLIMRLTIHLCFRSKKPVLYIIIIALLFVGIYILTNGLNISLPLTIEGLIKCMPLYLLGYLTKHYRWIDNISRYKDILGATLFISISIGVSFIYKSPRCLVYQISSFYIILITATYGFLFLCKVFNSIKSHIIVNISIGTLMIMGVHWMYIGTTNFILEHLFSMNKGIAYSWPLAILFAICINAAIYPLIILAKRHMPVLLGK